MPADLVEVISGPFYEPVTAYKMREGNQEIRFEKEAVMHGKLFNPRYLSGSWVYGLSPIQVAQEIITALNSGNKALAHSFMNMGPPVIISSQMPEGLTPQQQEMLEETYRKKYGGMQRDGSFSRQPMLTGTPVKVERLGDSAVDLNLLESSDWTWKVLCNVYGVSSVLFNDNSQSTYNNVQQARVDFYEQTIKPLNAMFADKLTGWLMPKERVRFGFDYSQIAVLQQSFYQQSQALKDIWFLTINERREKLGMNPLDDPAADEIYIPTGYVPLDEVGMDSGLMQQEFLDKGNGKTKEPGKVELPRVQKSA
jgi:HK97 family phage portal protein